MANLWRNIAYSYVSKEKLDQIYEAVARDELEDYIDYYIFEHEKCGWTVPYERLKRVAITEYARRQDFYASHARRTGTERAFEIGVRVALDRLGRKDLIGGK